MASTTPASELGFSPQDMVPVDAGFIRFPELPIELRSIIWEMALPGPSCIEIALLERGTHPRYIHLFRSSDNPPAILFVCQESQQAALKHYKPFELRRFWTTRTSFIDPLRDILFYNGPYLTLDVLEGVFELIPNITRLALTAFNLCDMLHTRPDFRRLGNIVDLIALPTVSIDFRKGPVVFEDLGERLWDKLIHQEDWGPSYLRIQVFEQFLRSLEDRKDVVFGFEGWLAPKLRIGKLTAVSDIAQHGPQLAPKQLRLDLLVSFDCTKPPPIARVFGRIKAEGMNSGYQ